MAGCGGSPPIQMPVIGFPPGSMPGDVPPGMYPPGGNIYDNMGDKSQVIVSKAS